MSCRHVRDWLHRDAASLDEAQRLQLDDHLATCEQCRGDRERMQTLHRAGSSLDSPPSDVRMYDRAIARALLEGPRTAEPTRVWWLVPVVLAAMAATALAAVIAVRSSNDTAKPAPVVPPAIPHVETHAASELPKPASTEPEVEMPIDHVDAPRKHDPASPPKRVTEAVADVLARARLELAAKHYADAERTASSVLAGASSSDEAEARTILADVAQASGQLELASTRYRDVATKFASLSAGESALYAAARVEARRGRDARVLLEQYLARYPRGRFVNDARRLLTTKEQR